MSITGPLMAINDRNKWIEERKQLTHPCAVNHHVIGVVRKTLSEVFLPITTLKSMVRNA